MVARTLLNVTFIRKLNVLLKIISAPCFTTDEPMEVGLLTVTLEQSISFCLFNRQATEIYVSSTIILGIEKVLKFEKINIRMMKL